MLSPASAGSKRPAAAISSNIHSGSTPKRSKSSTLTPSENETDSGSDTPFLTRSHALSPPKQHSLTLGLGYITDLHIPSSLDSLLAILKVIQFFSAADLYFDFH
ncbi:hypothetical protein BOTCAL_0225g00150 [Botryotinia calthae]|uniref:Uncharacterized protein n=1 Tax=Botryotinia calthae TaxID=38488 RepID=A0A4Y8CXX3_9HELO|nr:hypothetical protein BOTCAL_0225g00150 [Botryotinia calthae]